MKYRANGLVLAALLISAIVATGTMEAAKSQSPSGGTISVRGEASAPDVMRLQITLEPLVSTVFSLGAVKIYAEPSHTLLAALVDPTRLALDGLAVVTSERPLATLRADLGREVAPMMAFKFAYASDSRVRVDYELIATDGSRVSHTVRDAKVGSLAKFAISSGPRLGGK